VDNVVRNRGAFCVNFGPGAGLVMIAAGITMIGPRDRSRGRDPGWELDVDDVVAHGEEMGEFVDAAEA
jgi:hypothetical protein